MDKQELKTNGKIIVPYSHIKAEAFRLGFSAFGAAPVEKVASTHIQYQQAWTDANYAADMEYLKRNTEVRQNPHLLLEEAKTIICLALSYTPPAEERNLESERWQLAWYARGEDYHRVMRRKLEELLHWLKETTETTQTDFSFSGRCFCDTAPLMERYWAWRCGLGWIGKNHQLIIPRQGSAFFLGELIINAQLDIYNSPFPENFCGTCTRCLDACPTGALNNPHGLDARKCLSYLTIEHRGPIPDLEASKMFPCFYGCDRCQAVCPHIKYADATTIAEFQERPAIREMTKNKWKNLDRETYQALFSHSAVKRVKYEGLIRNITAMDKNAPKEK